MDAAPAAAPADVDAAPAASPPPRRGPSLRARLAVVIVALVGLTAAVLGIGASAFVDTSLRAQFLGDARRQADYDLAVLLPGTITGAPTRDSFAASGLLDAFGLRGTSETIADFGDGDPMISSFDLRGVLATLPVELRATVDRGELGYAWLVVAGRPSLVVGGRSATGGPALFFVHDATEIDRAVTQLRIALLVGALGLVVIALLTARAVARGILRPIDTAGRTAARIAAGDLAARVPDASSDEFGSLTREFNRMAATLEETIERLRAAEVRNRRFVSDVAHELRTPLTALVAEASIMREGLDALPSAARRAAELLVGDVARLRTLVEDLMELSRFDANAEQVARAPVELGGRLRALVEARLPTAVTHVPAGGFVVETDPRRFDRIIGNVLDNAREHAPGAPVIASLAIDRVAGIVRIAVADRGPGVDPATIARIFERFEKADAARGGGSGLGLALAREHATLLGGTLSAAPNPGGGLRVELTLPLPADAESADAGSFDLPSDSSTVTPSLQSGNPTVMPPDDSGTPPDPAARAPR